MPELGWIELICIAFFIATICFHVGKILGRKKASVGEGFFSTVFKSNRDLDTTISLFGSFLLVIFMAYLFRSEIKEEAALIFMGAFNLISYLARDKPNGHHNGNGHTVMQHAPIEEKEIVNSDEKDDNINDNVNDELKNKLANLKI